MQKRLFFLLILLASIYGFAQKKQPPKTASIYYPSKDNWQHRAPQSMGWDTALLSNAIQYAIEKENKAPRNLEAAHFMTFGKEPYGDPWDHLLNAERLPASLFTKAILFHNGAHPKEWT